MSNIKEALEIVGAEDFSDDGKTGWVELTGEDAAAIITAMDRAPSHKHYLEGHPFKLSRNGGLELWCNGWYSEGRGVRGIIHRAAKLIEGE